jgi:peptide/nickel transport system permease protein
MYMGNLFRGNLGQSLQSRRPVMDDLIDYFPATFELTLFASILAIVGGVALGILSALKQNKLIDHLGRIFALTGISMPVFWLGLLLVIFLYRDLGWLPFGGRLDASLTPPTHITGLYVLDSLLTGNWETLGSSLSHLVLPALTLALGSMGIIARMTRASLLDVMPADYIRTARAKGLTEKVIMIKHVLGNSLFPIITIIGLQFGNLLSGAFLVEVIFSWPGLGTYAMKAILFLDYNGIIGVTMLIGLVFMVVNFLVDMLYILIDPRIRQL